CPRRRAGAENLRWCIGYLARSGAAVRSACHGATRRAIRATRFSLHCSPKGRRRYPPEFPQQMIEFVWAGRTPHALSRARERDSRKGGRALRFVTIARNIAPRSAADGQLPRARGRV